MKGSVKKMFRNRLLALLLCFAMPLQSFVPFVTVPVYGAEAGTVSEETSGPVIPEDEVRTDEQVFEEVAGETAFYPQSCEESLTPEEIQAAKEFYHIEKEEIPEPSAEEIEAELKEKDRLREEAEKGLTDDSGKLSGWDDASAGSEASKKGEEAAGVAEPTYTGTIGGEKTEGTIQELVNKSIERGQDLWLEKVTIRSTKPIDIPVGKTANIRLKKCTFTGDNLEKNPIFRVGKDATLRIYGHSGDRENDSICKGGNGAIQVNDKGTLVLSDLKLYHNSSDSNGGGLYLGSSVNCRLFNVRMNGNTAQNGGAIYGHGGSTNIETDARTVIEENKAYNNGGGIYLNGSSIRIYGPARGRTKVRKNNAGGYGGGIYFHGSGSSTKGLDFEENSSYNWGGGVMMQGNKCSVADSDIISNKSASYGGGVYINTKVGSLTDVKIKGNESGKDYDGGGIYVDSMGNIKSGGLFYVYDNHSGTGSGSYENDLFLQNGTFTNAYLHAAAYAPGSKIGIGVSSWNEGQRITFEPGNFNPRLFEVNNATYSKRKNKKVKDKTFYVTADMDPDSSTFRHLVLTTKKESALVAPDPTGVDLSKKDKSEDSGFKYEAQDGNAYTVYQGYSSFPSFYDSKKDLLLKYFYSDGYFFDDPKTYNPHLASFALHLIGAAANSNIKGSEDYSYKFVNIKNMLKGIGCKEEDIWICPDYLVKPATDSIGFAIGKKTVKSPAGTYTLVPIAIRSWGYESEWASNVTLNGSNVDPEGGEASGFKNAAEQVVKAVKTYAANYDLEDDLLQGRVKFFVTGYSRGSATANLASKMLIDTYGELSEKYRDKPNRVFGYCLAVPMGGSDKADTSLNKNRAAYHCIHNIINNVDLVPFVAPSQMGFKHYGVDHFIPGEDAGNVKTKTDFAKAENGGYRRTTFYDNKGWDVGTFNYSVKKAAMLKQLSIIDSGIFFVDWFKETDLNVSIGQAVSATIKGLFTETSPVTMTEVPGSTKNQAQWLAEFFDTFQKYYTVGKDKTLTRPYYSNEVIRGGKTPKAKRSAHDRDWYKKGNTAQDAFRTLVPMVFSKSPEESADMMAAFSGITDKLGTMDLKSIYDNLINNSTGWDKEDEGKNQQRYLDMFWNALTDDSHGKKAIQNALTKKEYADLENVFPSLMGIAMRLVRQDFNDKAHVGKMRLFGTLGANSDAIAQAHVPEIYLAWLQSCDSYYTSESGVFKWKDIYYVPGEVSFHISGNDVTSKGTVEGLEGDQIIRLKSSRPDNSDSIFYEIRSSADKAGAKPVLMLYNDRQGIRLNAPSGSSGSVTYTLKAWTKNLNTSPDVSWIEGTDKECSFKIGAKSSENAVMVKVKKLVHGGSGWTWSEESPEYEQAAADKERVSFNSDLIEEAYYPQGDYYFLRWKYGTERKDFLKVFGDKVRSDGGKPVAAEAYFMPVVTGVSVKEADKLRPVISQNLVTNIGISYKVGDDALPVLPDSVPVSWLEEKDGEYVPVSDRVAKAGTNYRAHITIPEKRRGEYPVVFKDTVDIKAGDIYSKNLSPDARGNISFFCDFETENTQNEASVSEGSARRVTVFSDDYDYPLESAEDIREVNADFVLSANKGCSVPADFDLLKSVREDWEDLVCWKEIVIENDEAKTEALSDNRTVWYEVSENDVYLQALKAPLLRGARLAMEAPKTGDSLSDSPDSLILDIGGESYEIDPDSVSVSWSASDNSADSDIAMSDTSYEALISVSADDLWYYDKEYDVVDEVPSFLPAGFGTVDLNVNGLTAGMVSENEASESQNAINAFGCFETLVSGNGMEKDGLVETFNIYVRFDKTDGPTFIDVEAPDGLSLSFNEATSGERYKKDIEPALPSRTAVMTDDLSVQTLSVNWVKEDVSIIDEEGKEKTLKDVVAYELFGYSDTEEDDDFIPGYPLTESDLNGLDDYNLVVEGYVTIPDGLGIETDEEGRPVNKNILLLKNGEAVEKYADADEVRCYFTYPVFLEGAPLSHIPEILPESTELEPEAKEVIVDFNTFPLSSDDNDVDVYYRFTYHDLDEDYEEEPLVWFGEDGKIEYDESQTRVFHSNQSAYTIEELAEDIKDRTVTRESLKSHGADYVKVSAVAVEKGAFRPSSQVEENYCFLEKATAVIPDDILEKLHDLTLESGKTLKDIELPQNCSFAQGTDLYEVHEGIEGETFDAVVVYNDDPVNFNDNRVQVKITIMDGYYSITATDCHAYLCDESNSGIQINPEKINSSKPGRLICVSSNGVPEGLDPSKAEIGDWILKDQNGNDLEWDYDETDSGVIYFEMPHASVRVRPVWYDSGTGLAPVQSLTLDQSFIELKKGGSATLKATVVYSAHDEDAYETPVSFISDDPDVVQVLSVSEGKAVLKALKSGKAKIWADCVDHTAVCTVNVGETLLDLQLTDCKAYDTSDSSGRPLEDSAVKGSTIRLEADAPKNDAFSFKEWTISGADIDRTKNPVTFRLYSDLVARPEFGIAPGFEDPGEYTFGSVKIKSLTLFDPETGKKTSKLTIPLNGTVSVNAKAVFKKETDKPPILFKSSNTDVLKVKTVSGADGEAQGIFVGCRAGVALVTAYCGNKTAKVTVTVGDEETTGLIVAGNRLAKSTTDDGQYQLELFTGEQEFLEVLPDPIDNVAETKFTWKSDDPKVATVRNGLITAKIADRGHTTVTVTAKTKPLGSTKWINLKPVKIVVRVREIAVPKKIRQDKSYSLSLKGSQNLDLNAARIGKKNVLSACGISAKLKGSAPAELIWESTNENIVTVSADKEDVLKADIKGTGIGTAYVVLKGRNSDKTLINQAVIKVTVRATSPELAFTNDALGQLEFDEEKPKLTLKQGSYDRIFCSVNSYEAGVSTYVTTERLIWSGKGGVTVKDGVVYAKSIPKKGKTASVVLKCGKSKIELPVTVE